MNFVTDTHALVWWFIDSPKISPKAAGIFEKCEKGEDLIFIPSIVIAEALVIFEKKRVSFDFKNLLVRIDNSRNFVIIPLDYPILREMLNLKEIAELHDKIIVSTARCLNASLITKDQSIRNLPYVVTTIW